MHAHAFRSLVIKAVLIQSFPTEEILEGVTALRP